ncbi:hypothetical protein AAE478_005298 [Parahypoxylon ruwenzoriense]
MEDTWSAYLGAGLFSKANGFEEELSKSAGYSGGEIAAAYAAGALCVKPSLQLTTAATFRNNVPHQAQYLLSVW